jgi:hypothetical protein
MRKPLPVLRSGEENKRRKNKVEKQTVSEKSLKSKALEFIRSLTVKQIGEVLGEGDVMYNDHLDCFFVWRGNRLVMYVNENDTKKEEPPLARYVELKKGDDTQVCEACEQVILDVGFIRLDDGRCFHYNPRCYPTKTKE